MAAGLPDRPRESGINFMKLDPLRSLIAALKVLVEAMVLMERGIEVEMGIEAPWDEATTQQLKEKVLLYAGQIRADVEETEAILFGFWEGILEETRRELEEQRQAAAAEAAVAVVAAAATTRKRKAAKRKQQKRKAQ